MSANKQQGFECPSCKNNYSTAYSMYRHMRKVHNIDTNRCVTLYCPIENCNQSYDRYNALDNHLEKIHLAHVRKEAFSFSDLSHFEAWLRDITASSKTKYIKRSCNNSYRYYRCHRSGLPKTSTDKINSMKSSVKIGRHCPSRIIAKITDRNIQVEFVPTHIGHECEIAKIPYTQKKRLDIACRLAATNNSVSGSVAAVAVSTDAQQQPPQQQIQAPHQQQQQQHNHDQHLQVPPPPQQQHQQQQPPPQQQQQQQQNNVNNPQATTSTIIQNDNSLMVTLAPMKTTTIQDQQQQLTQPMQQAHLMKAQLTQQQQQLPNNTNMSLIQISPNRHELTNRFEQLMSSIRSDKHASIVKAQLEVCFALIRD